MGTTMIEKLDIAEEALKTLGEKYCSKLDKEGRQYSGMYSHFRGRNFMTPDIAYVGVLKCNENIAMELSYGTFPRDTVICGVTFRHRRYGRRGIDDELSGGGTDVQGAEEIIKAAIEEYKKDEQ